VATYPDSTKTSLEQRLRARARERWPQIASLQIHHRGTFSYIDATLTDTTTLKLCRLRYVGSAGQWQFAIYRASHDDYDESVFFTGLPVGTCQDALDTACGLYLNDPTAWTRPPTNLRARPLSAAAHGAGSKTAPGPVTAARPPRAATAGSSAMSPWCPPPRPGSPPHRRQGAPAQGLSRRCARYRRPLPQAAASNRCRGPPPAPRRPLPAAAAAPPATRTGPRSPRSR
jgi:hypothetical protein